jgi:hypothetical protein
MKNKTPMNENKNLSWLYEEAQDEDFLTGKTPSNLEYIWEDDEE